MCIFATVFVSAHTYSALKAMWSIGPQAVIESVAAAVCHGVNRILGPERPEREVVARETLKNVLCPHALIDLVIDYGSKWECIANERCDYRGRNHSPVRSSDNIYEAVTTHVEHKEPGRTYFTPGPLIVSSVNPAQEIYRLTPPMGEWFHYPAFSPDNKQLAICSDTALKVMQTHNGQEVYTVKLPDEVKNNLVALCVLNHRRYVLGGHDSITVCAVTKRHHDTYELDVLQTLAHDAQDGGLGKIVAQSDGTFQTLHFRNKKKTWKKSMPQ